MGATNVDRRFLDAEVGAAGRGGRPLPEMPRGNGAPSRRGGGLVRLGPSLPGPQAGCPSPRGADPSMAGSLPAAGEDLRRRRGGMVAAADGAGATTARSPSRANQRRGERGEKKWGSRVGWKQRANSSRGSGPKFGGLHEMIAHLEVWLELFFPLGRLKPEIEAHLVSRLELL